MPVPCHGTPWHLPMNPSRRTPSSGRPAARFAASSAGCFLLGLTAGRWLAQRAQQELKTVQANRQIVQHAHEAIISADAANVVVMANPAAAQVFGTSVDDMIGSPLGRFIDSGAGVDEGPAE